MMDCVLTALLTCLSWSNLYLDAGLSLQDRGASDMRYTYSGGPSGPQLASIKRTYDEPMNPYGRFALGYEIDFGRFKLVFDLSHISSAADGDDKGVNAIAVSGRWYPFRH